MERILVTGATGQIGSELVPALRERYGAENIIAAGHRRTPPSSLESGPYETLDVTKYDQIESLIEENQITRIFHTDFNVNAMSFTPQDLAKSIRRKIPTFKMDYQVVAKKQDIADTWPRSLDDSLSREEWGWKPDWGLDAMVDDVLVNLERRLATERR